MKDFDYAQCYKNRVSYMMINDGSKCPGKWVLNKRCVIELGARSLAEQCETCPHRAQTVDDFQRYIEGRGER